MSIIVGKAITVALLVVPAGILCFAGIRMSRRGLLSFLAALVFAGVWLVLALTCIRDPNIGKATARGFPLWYPIGYTAVAAPLLAVVVGRCRRSP